MRVYAIENHPNDSRVTIDPQGIVQTLSSRMGTGGNNTPFVLITSTKADSQSGSRTPSQACEPKADHAETEAKDLCAMRKAYCCGNGQLDNAVVSPIAGTLDCMHDQKIVLMEDDNVESERKYVLRRLTPTECARLQGFPDWWCDGADGSDSAQYKLWGNGVALPCVAFIMSNIVKE